MPVAFFCQHGGTDVCKLTFAYESYGESDGIFLPERMEVVVAGAGPSGLALAAELMRLGVEPTIICSKVDTR